jgi:hypothetical protein
VRGNRAELRLNFGNKMFVAAFGCRKKDWSLRDIEVRRGERTATFTRGELAKAMAALLGHEPLAPAPQAISATSGPVTAEHLIVIGRGRLIADTPAAEFIARAAPGTVRVRGTDPAALVRALREPGVTITPAGSGALTVTGLSTDQVALAATGLTVLELTAEHASLEEAFIDLTRDAVEYRAATTTQENTDARP